MSEENKPKWADEAMPSVPVPDDIQCKTCEFRQKDIRLSDGTYVKRHTSAECEKFAYMKPREVLWEHAKCPLYKDENEEE